MSCLYQILGVSPSASEHEIKMRYKRLALKYHPDRNLASPKIAELRFKEVSKAYEILRDSRKRREYDNERMGFSNQFHSVSPNGPSYFFSSQAAINVFNEIFNSPEDDFFDFFSFDTKPKKTRHRKPSERFFSPQTSPKEDISFNRTINVSLEDMQSGKLIYLTADEDIADCCGIFKDEIDYNLAIPAGTIPNETVPVQIGDAIVNYTINAKKHDIYNLTKDNDLAVKYDISVADALCGCYIKVRAFDGTEKSIHLTDIITPDYEIVFEQKGLYSSKNDCYTNLIVSFNITYPKSLTREQKQMIRNGFDVQ